MAGQHFRTMSSAVCGCSNYPFKLHAFFLRYASGGVLLEQESPGQFDGEWDIFADTAVVEIRGTAALIPTALVITPLILFESVFFRLFVCRLVFCKMFPMFYNIHVTGSITVDRNIKYSNICTIAISCDIICVPYCWLRHALRLSFVLAVISSYPSSLYLQRNPLLKSNRLGINAR